MRERAIELVQEKLHEYALSLNDDIVSTTTDGASIMMKFGRETEPLHFSCQAYAIYLSVCDVLDTKKPKQISDKCLDDGGTGKASDKSDGEENAEEKSDEQECDKEQQNCFDIIPEIKEIIKKVKKCQKFLQISCKKWRQFATTSSSVFRKGKKFVSGLQNSLEQFAEYASK